MQQKNHDNGEGNCKGVDSGKGNLSSGPHGYQRGEGETGFREPDGAGFYGVKRPGGENEPGGKPEEELLTDYLDEDADLYEDDDDEFQDDYDDYLEEGYEDDPEKDNPQECDLEYLKNLEDDEDDFGNGYGDEPPRKSPLLRLVAVMTVAAFLGLALAASWPVLQFPLAELVGRSLQLQKDIDVHRLQAAVVQIDVVSRRQGPRITAERRSGTGFNISSEGLVITNHHVIDGALNMTITFPGGKIYGAESWVSKPEFDLAIIRLRGESLPVVPVNTGGPPAGGDRIRVVGNPLGLNNVVVEGKVDRYLRVRDNPEPVFSIDAPVYPGNSGSPVFDKNGDVVGVVFARYIMEADGEEKIFGLAVPISEIQGSDLNKQ